MEFTWWSVGDAENPATEEASKSNATRYRNRAIFQLSSINCCWFNQQMRNAELDTKGNCVIVVSESFGQNVFLHFSIALFHHPKDNRTVIYKQCSAQWEIITHGPQATKRHSHCVHLCFTSNLWLGNELCRFSYRCFILTHAPPPCNFLIRI